MLFPKAPASCGILFVRAQKVFPIFKILFQTGNINTFVLYCVLSIGYVQLKSSFSDEQKISAVKSETHFSREVI